MKLKTFEEKKKYLKRYSKMFEKYRTLTNRLETLTIEYEKTQDFSVKMRIEDTEYRIKNLHANYAKLRREIFDLIDTLDDQKQIDVLEQFFIEDKTLKEISDTMGYSERQIIRLYKKGVNLLLIET